MIATHSQSHTTISLSIGNTSCSTAALHKWVCHRVLCAFTATMQQRLGTSCHANQRSYRGVAETPGDLIDVSVSWPQDTVWEVWCVDCIGEVLHAKPAVDNSIWLCLLISCWHAVLWNKLVTFTCITKHSASCMRYPISKQSWHTCSVILTHTHLGLPTYKANVLLYGLAEFYFLV